MYHMRILLGDFNVKVGENIFQPTIGTESVHPESNATYENLIVKSIQMVSHAIRSCSGR